MNLSCPSCRSSNIVQDGERGEACCIDCGVVVADRIGVDVGTISDTNTPVPAGERPTLMGYSAVPDRAEARMRERDGWVASYGVASALRGGSLRSLRSMHDKLGLPEGVYARAVEIYTKTATKRLTRGRQLMSLMAASLYMACREADVPRTLNDIRKVADLTRKAIAKDIRFLEEKHAVHPRQYSLPGLITRIANRVGVTQACLQAAIDTAEKLDAVYLGGKNPLVIAAATLYLVVLRRSDGHTETELAAAGGVSTVSMRNRAREMEAMV